jgi:methylenetetrahydrofolate--tRNA-(uracil-5-)-methyltransferase
MWSESPDLVVIGGGLAGSEAAWQAAESGLKVALFEMRPALQTGAHTGPWLAELVCSNSLGTKLSYRASGLLKEELGRLGSMVLKCAEQTEVPAGNALAVDRHAFAQLVTERVESHPQIRIIREEVTEIPELPTVIASGPLTSASLSQAILRLTGEKNLYFYDAIAPIVRAETINMGVAFRASRYNKGEQEAGDYVNCPFTRDEYYSFVDQLIFAERIELKDFEKEIEQGVRAGKDRFFEGCLPIEILAQRGRDGLAFGPMRPVGLFDSRKASRPFAVVQLRQDNLAGSLYNMVGFQTNLKFSEQQRIFHMIPGLGQAEFERYGQMHRNTFIFSPAKLLPSLQFRGREDLFFAGQITGVEGYVGNIATGLLAGVNIARYLRGETILALPESTMIGGLCRYITNASVEDFQPMKANFGLLPALDEGKERGKQARGIQYRDRARLDLEMYLSNQGINSHSQLNFMI